MRPSDYKELIKSLRQVKNSDRALLIEGSPGLGKTQIVAQAANELGIGFKQVHAPLMQPEDYGMPVVYGKDKDKLKFVVSSNKFPLVGSKDDCPDEGILLIDELPQTDMAGQKILANLVQEREIHGYKIKPGWSIVATGNRAKDRAGANRILGHLGNRVTRIELEVSLDDWTKWALQSGKVATEVIAFIRFRPEFLNNYDPQQEINATPRAWVEGVAARLGVIPKGLEFPVIAGDVGEGPATEFLAFLDIYRNLPNPDAILLNPKKADVPKDLSTQYAIVGALVSRVDEENFGRALTYIKRLPKEFSVLFVKDAVDKCQDICTTSDFIAWASQEGKDLIL